MVVLPRFGPARANSRVRLQLLHRAAGSMPRPLKIGVNALYLIPGGVGGTEIYIRNLLAALAAIDKHNQYFVFTNRETGKDLCPRTQNFQPVTARLPARFRPARLLWEQTVLPAQALARRIDVMFSAGFTAPLLTSARKVTVIHDLQHKKQPGNFGALERRAWDLMVWSGVRHSRWLITPSEATKRDVVKTYGVAASKVRAIHHGVEPDFLGLGGNPFYEESFLAQAGIPRQRYLLAVSTIHPHKNWERLLDAYQQLAEQGYIEHLVVAGLPGKSWNAVQRHLERTGLDDRVHLLGWQPRRVLLALFKFAEALVFPSTFEGFGIPVLEAMAAGLPVACSDIPPLREIADGAAVFFDPTSSEAIREGMKTVLGDLGVREQIVARGLAKAKHCTWQRTAEQTLAVLLDAGRR